VALLLLLSSFNLLTPKVVLGFNEDEVNTSIQLADKAVSSAFEAVSEAETAGGNVTELIVRLNHASDLLDEAMSLSRNGSSDNNVIIELSNNSAEIANSVKNDAANLEASSLSSHDSNFQFIIIASSIGELIFIFFMFIFWHWFKGYYTRKSLSLKPEVVEDVNA